MAEKAKPNKDALNRFIRLVPTIRLDRIDDRYQTAGGANFSLDDKRDIHENMFGWKFNKCCAVARAMSGTPKPEGLESLDELLEGSLPLQYMLKSELLKSIQITLSRNGDDTSCQFLFDIKHEIEENSIDKLIPCVKALVAYIVGVVQIRQILKPIVLLCGDLAKGGDAPNLCDLSLDAFRQSQIQPNSAASCEGVELMPMVKPHLPMTSDRFCKLLSVYPNDFSKPIVQHRHAYLAQLLTREQVECFCNIVFEISQNNAYTQMTFLELEFWMPVLHLVVGADELNQASDAYVIGGGQFGRFKIQPRGRQVLEKLIWVLSCIPMKIVAFSRAEFVEKLFGMEHEPSSYHKNFCQSNIATVRTDIIVAFRDAIDEYTLKAKQKHAGELEALLRLKDNLDTLLDHQLHSICGSIRSGSALFYGIFRSNARQKSNYLFSDFRKDVDQVDGLQTKINAILSDGHPYKGIVTWVQQEMVECHMESWLINWPSQPILVLQRNIAYVVSQLQCDPAEVILEVKLFCQYVNPLFGVEVEKFTFSKEIKPPIGQWMLDPKFVDERAAKTLFDQMVLGPLSEVIDVAQVLLQAIYISIYQRKYRLAYAILYQLRYSEQFKEYWPKVIAVLFPDYTGQLNEEYQIILDFKALLAVDEMPQAISFLRKYNHLFPELELMLSGPFARLTSHFEDVLQKYFRREQGCQIPLFHCFLTMPVSKMAEAIVGRNLAEQLVPIIAESFRKIYSEDKFKELLDALFVPTSDFLKQLQVKYVRDILAEGKMFDSVFLVG